MPTSSHQQLNGGSHEDAAHAPVNIWRRRHFDDASREGFRTNDLGSLTRPAHAAEEPGRSHASAATSPHNQFQFARLSPGGSSMAGGPQGPSSPVQWGSPVPLNHRERVYDDSRAGGEPGRAARCRHAPVHDGWGAGTLPRVGIVDHYSRGLTLPRNTGRGFGSGAFCKFGLRGCVNTHLARFHAHGDCRLKCVAKGLPSQFETSVSCAATKAHEARNAVHENRKAGSSNDR